MENKIGGAGIAPPPVPYFTTSPTRSLLWITGCEFGLINIPSLVVVLP